MDSSEEKILQIVRFTNIQGIPAFPPRRAGAGMTFPYYLHLKLTSVFLCGLRTSVVSAAPDSDQQSKLII